MSVSDMFSKDKTMYGNAKFKTAPIIDVTKENVSSVGALVRGAIIGADFIAIDCVRVQADFRFFQNVTFRAFLAFYVRNGFVRPSNNQNRIPCHKFADE